MLQFIIQRAVICYLISKCPQMLLNILKHFREQIKFMYVSVDIILLSQNAQCLCPDSLPVLTNMTPPSLSILLPSCTWSSQPARLSWTDEGWKNILAGLMDSSPHSREVLMEFTNRATPEERGRWQPAG